MPSLPICSHLSDIFGFYGAEDIYDDLSAL